MSNGKRLPIHQNMGDGKIVECPTQYDRMCDKCLRTMLVGAITRLSNTAECLVEAFDDRNNNYASMMLGMAPPVPNPDSLEIMTAQVTGMMREEMKRMVQRTQAAVENEKLIRDAAGGSGEKPQP